VILGPFSHPPRSATVVAALACLLISFASLAVFAQDEPVWRHVERVVDGDTIVVEGIGSVRLIGVDTPETKHPRKPVQYFGREASAFTKKLVEGEQVRLTYDQNRRDKYGRTLAYVHLRDGRCLNEEIIRRGYGYALTRFPFRHLERYRQLEREAREARRGLWAPRPSSSLRDAFDARASFNPRPALR
jgi:micrococcal nuclease